jgi:hypothetical protein
MPKDLIPMESIAFLLQRLNPWHAWRLVYEGVHSFFAAEVKSQEA